MRPTWNLFRFGVVSVGGLIFDISIAWALAVYVGFSLPLAALLGFMGGATFNYILHETWTFRTSEADFSSRRWLLYMATLAAVALSRIGIIKLLENILFVEKRGEFATLIVATGASFFVNYILSRNFVFRYKKTEDDTNQKC